MKIIIAFLEILSLLEILIWYGFAGSYETGNITGREFIIGTIISAAVLYITIKLIKVSAAVTANNNRRKKMVKSLTINHFHNTTKR